MLRNKAHRKSTELNESHCKDEYYTAKFYGVSVGTIRRWRSLRQGPRYRKIGSLVRYSVEDLDAWLASRPEGGESVKEAAHE